MIKGRILYDVTKASKQRQKSGIARVSSCLRREFKALLGDSLVEVVWDEKNEAFRRRDKSTDLQLDANDVLLTCELFCEYERRGIERFLEECPCLSYAIFHDAIPLQHPEFTWPHSVQRHPSYMKMLALFSGVFAVSSHSAILLEEYWEWLDLKETPSVRSIQLGADGVFKEPSNPKQENNDRIQLLTLAILEKRKGQDLAFEAAKKIWDDGMDFDYHFVGRTNPYFGKEIERSLRKSAKRGYAVQLHGQLKDEELRDLFAKTDLVVLPSLAEGCGLPVLEALWKGVPTLSSSLHSVRENARFGGCQLFETGDFGALTSGLRELISDREKLRDLTNSIQTDMLPRWNHTVTDIVDHIVTEGGL